MKRGIYILFSIIFLIFSLNIASASTTVTDTYINTTGNLTLGEKITFTLGEVIDNIVDGWITITGGLNVTQNLTVGGHIKVGNINPRITENKVMAEGGFVTHGGYSGRNSNESAIVKLWDNHHSTTYHTILTNSGEFDNTANVFCDYTANVFTLEDAIRPKNWIVVISENSPKYIGRIEVFINSSCVFLSDNPGWKTDFSGVNWIIKDPPTVLFSDEGAFRFWVHNDEFSRWRITTPNATGFYGAYIDEVVGAAQHQSLTVDTDTKNYGGVTGLNVHTYSSTPVDNKLGINTLLEIDGTDVSNSEELFIKMDLIGQPTNSEIYGISMDEKINHLIHVGSSDTVSSAYYNAVNVTTNFTDVGNDAEVFVNDNDVVYVGNEGNFTTISVALSTESSSPLDLTYAYCNSSNEWETLTGVTDTTNGFQVSGSIVFENPTDRGTCNKETDGTAFSDTTNYAYIALTRTRNNVVTSPIIDRLDISGSSTNMYMTADLLKLNAVNTAPETCNSANLGAIYFDTGEDDMCVCKSTGWKVMTDGTDCT